MSVIGPDLIGGVVVVVEGEVTPSLRRTARKRSLTILEGETADQAFQHICGAHPRVIIVQVGQEPGETLKFIQLAAAASPRIPLIAAVVEHTAELERQVLHSGPTYYVPTVSPELLDPLLEAVATAEQWK